MIKLQELHDSRNLDPQAWAASLVQHVQENPHRGTCIDCLEQWFRCAFETTRIVESEGDKRDSL